MVAEGPPTPWSLTPDEAVRALGTPPGGLSPPEARARLERWGPNSLAAESRAGMVRLFLRQFTNPLVFILVAAALVAGAAGDAANAVIIVVVLAGSALLTGIQEYRAGNAVERLRSRMVLRTRVLRAGREEEVPSAEVVPGDLVRLSAGSLVPADGVILEANDLFLNQAVLTGESFPVEKVPGAVPAGAGLAERTNMVFMGTSVRSGTGLYLVTATGGRTAHGAVGARLARRAPDTEFEKGIRRFGYLLTRVILLLVLVVFAGNVFLQRPPLEALLFAVALAVGISPELLPGIIGVSLARGARAMAGEGVLVRRLNAIEDFGSMDVLCSDKTGTLTEGRVELEAAVDPEGASSDGVFRIALTHAWLQAGMENPLDEAIRRAGGADPPATLPGKLGEIPYDFVRRRMTVVVEDGPGGARFLTKGAVAQVLGACLRVRKGEGAEVLSDPERASLEARVERWASSGLRVLAVATARLPRQRRYAREQEGDLTFEGFLLFLDRPREGVDRVIRELRELGVRVKLVTGDSRFVAQHVAERVGLEKGEVLTGRELGEMRDEALWQRAPGVSVFAEVDPNQKERIILALRRTGHVVGYLGDGINDAPALHIADVGISVDTAADVARESADLVLLKGDLEVLRRGILEGRRTLANTLKYVYITTSANFGNMVSMAVASLFLPFLPLLARQILLNNFLSDLPAVALTSDRVDGDWVARPRRWEVRPVQLFMVVFGLVSSVFDFLAFALLLLVFQAGPELFRTGWFVLSLLTELVVLFVVRTRGPLRASRPSTPLVAAALLTGLLAVGLPFMGFGARFFDLVPLPVEVLGAMTLLVVGYGIATELTKGWFYRTVGRWEEGRKDVDPMPRRGSLP